MLSYQSIDKTTDNLQEIEALYNHAFPENERYPFDALLEKDGFTDFYSFYHNDLFVGILAMFTVEDMSHIVYFAVPEHLRGKGYGSRILQTVHRIREGQRFLVDIERAVEDAPEDDYRRVRRRFYERNGYEETIKKYIWQEEAYEVLSYGGPLGNDDWRHFWLTMYANKPSIC